MTDSSLLFTKKGEGLPPFAEGLNTNRLTMRMAALSLACHIALVTCAIIIPDFENSQRVRPAAVQVDLITLSDIPAQTSQSPAPTREIPPAPASESPIQEKTAPQTKPVLKKPKQSATKKNISPAAGRMRVKHSLKKKTYKPENVIKNAIKNIQKELPRSGAKRVAAAIGRLKAEVESQQNAGIGTQGVKGNEQLLRAMDIYNAEIWRLIQKKWAFSNQLARGTQNLEAVIIAKIMKNGEIRDVWFEERSGNSYFDNSVSYAIKKSNPLPPLPAGYTRIFYEVGIRFNLSELRKK